MKSKNYLTFLFILFLLSCSNKDSIKSDKPEKGMKATARGEVELSPAQLSKGVIEGISFIPYLANSKILTINDLLNKAKIKISLEIAYEYAYDKKLKSVKNDGDSGQVFSSMKVSTEHFQKILKRYGLKNYSQFILTSIDTDREYILFAVIERKVNFIKVIDKEKETIQLSLNPDDLKYYEPYEKDIADNQLDTIIDFGAVPRNESATQKMQSILLTMAANSVLEKKKSPSYWAIEKRWLKGEATSVMQESHANIEKRIGSD